jgi:glutathione S-transferase
MAFTFYAASGSPYAWRVWLALEHKRAAYDLRMLSFDSGDLKTLEFGALNPRRRVPVIEDDGFALYESAAILDYIEERFTDCPSLYATDLRTRATQRRLIREADQYIAEPMERIVEAVLFTPPEKRDAHEIAEASVKLKQEFALWEAYVGAGYLAGDISAADYTLFPLAALTLRIGARNPGTVPPDVIGPNLTAWMERMRALPIMDKTWPPHWR